MAAPQEAQGAMRYVYDLGARAARAAVPCSATVESCGPATPGVNVRGARADVALLDLPRGSQRWHRNSASASGRGELAPG